MSDAAEAFVLAFEREALTQLLANHRLRMEEIKGMPLRSVIESGKLEDAELASLRSFHNAVVELMKGIEP
jgi:hypothetical protein